MRIRNTADILDVTYLTNCYDFHLLAIFDKNTDLEPPFPDVPLFIYWKDWLSSNSSDINTKLQINPYNGITMGKRGPKTRFNERQTWTLSASRKRCATLAGCGTVSGS